jgi:DNA-binding NarL/FixJ family response regulator
MQPADPAIRVLTVDDHPGFLATARDLISATPGFETVGEADSGERAVELAERLRPDLVLLDVHMPGIGGIVAAGRIAEGCPETLIVLVSAYAVDDLPAEALRCGAFAVLPKHRLRSRALARLWELGAAAPTGAPLTSLDLEG